ncbi:MAG: DNA-formamidopyrimidine glycosylase family protein [Burkholderiales bacterium]|nr:DNA-formamidopyrimidine glycosylase family protein [Burkholderiales bacterium]
MPELPDIVVYCESLESRIVGHTLANIRIVSPFLVRTFDPPLTTAHGKQVLGVRRLGKRIVLNLEDDLFLVMHLMIAGRLRWLKPAAKPPGKITQALLEFDNGQLAFTEAGSKRRASLHLVRGEAAMRALHRGGMEPLDCSLEAFATQLRRENRTVKRALTDPAIFSGIGNSYSDEILHRARLSPFALTQKMGEEEVARLHAATRDVLTEWSARLRAAAGDQFPEGVTAFRPEMAVHGKYNQPCPDCGAPVQRIVHAENECNYCARCQTGGRLLADRSLSRLLHDSWPKTLDDL